MMPDSEVEAFHLKSALVSARAELQLRTAALSRLQDEMVASRQEVAGLRSAAVHLRGYIAQSQDDVESAHAHIAELNTYITRREAELQAAVTVLQADVNALRASFSWRITASARVAVTALRRMRHMFNRGRSSPVASVDTPQMPHVADPNAPYLFKPAPLPALGAGAVTVEELYALSRRPDA